MKRRLVTGLGIVAASIGLATALVRELPSPEAHSGPTSQPGDAAEPKALAALKAKALSPEMERAAVLHRELAIPDGDPPALRCADARRIIGQARGQLAQPPSKMGDEEFARATIDWLDPHGMWAVAPDCPLRQAMARKAGALRKELETPPTDGTCPVAASLGKELSQWFARLRKQYALGFGETNNPNREHAFGLAAEGIFENGVVKRSALDLARDLGRRSRSLQLSRGASLRLELESAKTRLLPGADVDASELLLAAAVRAYVPLLDPHAAWAPFDEETSLYDVDLEAQPPARIFRGLVRTALGLRITSSPAPGLRQGDLVLGIRGVPTAGLSVEQAEQLGMVEARPDSKGQLAYPTVNVRIWRPGEPEPRRMEVAFVQEEPKSQDPAPLGLDSQRVAFGRGSVLVINVPDVPDDLGEELRAALSAATKRGPITGVVLDLRGNGGGSTDGARSAIGLFLPGARLFPLRRRDGIIEVERASRSEGAYRWSGPVATLVDGDSASAAEMIAGGLAAYGRAPSLGARTFGKGCAQEYLEDAAQTGVLRLTTLVYALPDGKPVQGTGIVPTLSVPMPRSREREALLPHALKPWRGPDVRDTAMVGVVGWPNHAGRVGPCNDGAVCEALRQLGNGTWAKGTKLPSEGPFARLKFQQQKSKKPRSFDRLERIVA